MRDIPYYSFRTACLVLFTIGFQARGQTVPSLYETAKIVIDIAESLQGQNPLWGRVGGSEATSLREAILASLAFTSKSAVRS